MTRLYIPGVTRDEEEPLYVCTVVVNEAGDTCGHPFFAGEHYAFQVHVGRCAREHMDTIRAASLRERAPVFDPENWDKEVEDHMQKVGERMKKEGRLTVNKNEKAGF